MKNLLYLLMAGWMISACTERPISEEGSPFTSQSPSRLCAAMEVLEADLAANPKLRQRMAEIEEQTRSFIARGDFKVSPQGSLQIPVIVNVIYRTESENISLEQIQSQIDVLNEDFNAANSDVSETPSMFRGVVGDFDIEFTLAGWFANIRQRNRGH